MNEETIGQLYDSLAPGESTVRGGLRLTRLAVPDCDHGNCKSVLVELSCRCQDVHYECGAVDYEHNHVECGYSPPEGDAA